MKPKLCDLKIGDKIQHYECGQIVDAVVTAVRPDGVETEFAPISWGREIYTRGYVIESTPLQAKYYNVVTPAAWKDGEPITINGDVPKYTPII